MFKSLKLITTITGMTGASIATTAMAVPTFANTESYIFKNQNWTKHFYSKEAAIKYLNNTDANKLFEQDGYNSRVVNEFHVTAALEGIKGSYLPEFDMRSGVVSTDSTDDVEKAYNELYSQFMAELAGHLMDSFGDLALEAYIPKSDIDGTASKVSESALNISEYSRGISDNAYSDSHEAFMSLINESKIMFEYNGVKYESVDLLIADWMTNEGYASDKAYKKVINHIRWEASGSYEDTTGANHSFEYIDSNPATDSDAFKLAAQEAYYNQMRIHEFYEQKVYTEDEWYITDAYASSRDEWINDEDNLVIFDKPMNSDLYNGSMGEAFGWMDLSSKEIQGIGKEMFPSGIRFGSWFSHFWQTENTSESLSQIPNIQNAISSSEDIAKLALLAWHTPSFENAGMNSTQHLQTNLDNFCSVDGTSNKDSDEWQSWTKFATYMGFDKMEIPVEDRIDANENTANAWWEPDCEGTYVDRDLANNNNVSRIDWFSETLLSYFGFEVNTNSIVLDNWLSADTSIDNVLLSSNYNFTFTEQSNRGTLLGKTVTEALFEGGTALPTEADYLNSGKEVEYDFIDWVNEQDIVLYWNNGEYRAKSKEEAVLLFDEAVRERINSEWADTEYTQVTTTHYDIHEDYYSWLIDMDSDFKLTEYKSINEARLAVQGLAEAKGLNTIWNELQVVTFLEDAFYNFNTSLIFNSIDEAKAHVEWSDTVEQVWSASGMNGNFSDLIEYSKKTFLVLEGFNNSKIDIAFDMNVAELSERIINGYDLSEIDSSIKNIEVVTSTFDKNKPADTYNLVTQVISLSIDSYRSSRTIWFETDEYRDDSKESETAAINAAREQLIAYWTKVIKNS